MKGETGRVRGRSESWGRWRREGMIPWCPGAPKNSLRKPVRPLTLPRVAQGVISLLTPKKEAMVLEDDEFLRQIFSDSGPEASLPRRHCSLS